MTRRDCRTSGHQLSHDTKPTPGLPVVVSTGPDNDPAQSEKLAELRPLGVGAILTKPCTANQLLHVLQWQVHRPLQFRDGRLGVVPHCQARMPDAISRLAPSPRPAKVFDTSKAGAKNDWR